MSVCCTWVLSEMMKHFNQILLQDIVQVGYLLFCYWYNSFIYQMLTMSWWELMSTKITASNAKKEETFCCVIPVPCHTISLVWILHWMKPLKECGVAHNVYVFNLSSWVGYFQFIQKFNNWLPVPVVVSLQIISHHFLGRLAPNLWMFHTMPKSFSPYFIILYFLCRIVVLNVQLPAILTCKV